MNNISRLLVAVGVGLIPWVAKAELKTENVILVTLDGLRWQEMFGGLDSRLANQNIGLVRDTRSLRERFKRDTPEEQREALLPFFWSTLVNEGQIWGDPDSKSTVMLENDQVFSYPGYNEILSGFPDPEIKSNAKKQNPNVTVLEWINQHNGFEGRVEAFCSWDVFPYIINEERSGIPVNAGWEHFEDMGDAALQKTLNTVTDEMGHFWPGIRIDWITHEGALDAMRHRKPRLLYVGYGETDDWSHDGRYDMYLDAANRTDRYIQDLWETAQSIPEYAGKTSIVITTDHGRGDEHPDWKSHGTSIEGAKQIWFAVIGPDTPAKGIVKKGAIVQGQTAATVAALLGLDYTEANPKARPPVKEAVGR